MKGTILMDLKPFVTDLINNYTKNMHNTMKFLTGTKESPLDNGILPGGSKKKLELSPEQQEKFKKDVVEDIYKNKNSMKVKELENILKSKVSADKIENFRKSVRGKESVKKEEFLKLLQNNAL